MKRAAVRFHVRRKIYRVQKRTTRRLLRRIGL
jgi:hypothetical protein